MGLAEREALTMPGGYEKSNDYGGPEPKWGGIWIIAVLIIFAGIIVALTYQ